MRRCMSYKSKLWESEATPRLDVLDKIGECNVMESPATLPSVKTPLWDVVAY